MPGFDSISAPAALGRLLCELRFSGIIEFKVAGGSILGLMLIGLLVLVGIRIRRARVARDTLETSIVPPGIPRRQATTEQSAGERTEIISPSIATNQTARPPAESPSQSGDRPRPNTLVVDDKKYNRMALSTLLEALGRTVLTANSDAEAVTLARAQPFDLYLLAYAPPSLNAPETARLIRTRAETATNPIILATTAKATPEKRMECLMSGIDELLTLPVSKEQLRQVLAEIEQRIKLSPEPNNPAPIPPDPLTNLRLLATRKRVNFSDEVELYLREFEGELDQLRALLGQNDAAATARHVHLLRGRCAFIYEGSIDLLLLEISQAAADGRWDEASAHWQRGHQTFGALRVRLLAIP